MSKITPRFIFVVSAILLAALSRVLPHFDNVTPIAAMALFGGACMNDKRFAFVVPILAMFISDCIIGFHSTMGFVYIAIIATTFLGTLLSSNIKFKSVATASVLSSFLFFVVTNFGHWASFMNFANGGAGLMQSYFDALPFFRNSLLGDLFYNAILFGSLYFAGIKFPKLAPVKVK